MSNFPLPDSVRIVGMEYTVNRDVTNLRGDNDQKLLGNIDYCTTTINLSDEQNLDKAIVVLWHEIVHGIARTFGVDLNEDDTDRMAHGVHQVLSDNPILARWYLYDLYPCVRNQPEAGS